MSSANGHGDRVALIIGGARGIGRGIAVRLASDGLDVAVADLPSMRSELGLYVVGFGLYGVPRALGEAGSEVDDAEVDDAEVDDSEPARTDHLTFEYQEISS
jgi:meso-butanediol dehydrogenase/(S,S)-butanediol dehydrogenase/diacetyl reductase